MKSYLTNKKKVNNYFFKSSLFDIKFHHLFFANKKIGYSLKVVIGNRCRKCRKSRMIFNYLYLLF